MTRPVVVVDNGLLGHLVADPRFGPFMACLAIVRDAPPAAGCGRCGRPGKDPDAYNRAKLCLVGLPQEQKDQLKGLLDTRTVRLYVNQGGKVVPFDF